MMKIAIDAMGGDHAPQAIVAGVVQASQTFDDVHFLLYGDEQQIAPLLPEGTRNVTIHHTTEKINSDDEPVKALRTKKDSSMVLAAKAVKEGQADAMFSAGNTGALLAAGLLIVGHIKGIDRPALMTVLPVLDQNRQFIFMDVGANADCKPENLNQFAVLGQYYARFVLNNQQPTIALLNNGTEATKGNELSKKAHTLLAANPHIHFVGNIEARELLTNPSDVVVADGFTGNAVLKTIEGTAIGLLQSIKNTIKSGGVTTKLGGLLVQSSLRGLRDNLDYAQHGGAVLFGLKAPVVKTHGAADEVAVFHTIKQIRTVLQTQVIRDLSEYFEEKSNEI